MKELAYGIGFALAGTFILVRKYYNRKLENHRRIYDGVIVDQLRRKKLEEEKIKSSTIKENTP